MKKLTSGRLLVPLSLACALLFVGASVAVAYAGLPGASSHTLAALNWSAPVPGGSATPACSSSSTSGGACVGGTSPNASITLNWSYTTGSHGVCNHATITITGIGTKTNQPCTGSWTLTNVPANTTYSYTRQFYNALNTQLGTTERDNFTTPTCVGTMIGRVFYDANGNGVYDSGEKYVANVGITCPSSPAQFNLNGATVKTKTGPQNFSVTPTLCNPGAYYSTQVTPGAYVVTMTPPAGWIKTTPDVSTSVSAGGSASPNPWFGIAQLPTATLAANPTTVTQGASSTLTWSSTNATTCTGSGFSTGNATSGSTKVGPSTTTNYSVTCANSAGQASSNATVTVLQPNISLSANPTRILTGATTTLTYTISNEQSCTLTDDAGNLLYSHSSGTTFSTTGTTTTGALTRSTDFTLSCNNGSGSGSAIVSTDTIVSVVPQFQEF